MARGIQRSRIFRDPRDYEDFLTRLGSILSKTEVRCYAWALLPDHFHLLLRSGNVPLGRVMRCLMTGYAVTFNGRHRRNGHLFQNRYKSIVCEEEPYFLVLVRYIHLNPLRAGLVRNLSELDRYPWSGHRALVGNGRNEWQETVEVLGRFSDKKVHAQRHYRSFMEQGLREQGSLDLEGGGQVRSLVLSEQDDPTEPREIAGSHDGRVLGGCGFVEKVLKETGLPLTVKKPRIPLPELVGKVSEWFKVELEDLFLGRRKKEVSSARALVSYLAVNKMGYRFSEVGEVLKVHPVSVARCLEKGREVFEHHQDLLEAF
jgi:REP element-mobilizing transposase RayT